MMTNRTNTNPAKTFGWLLRREFWEYRGAMLWAPVLVGAAMCVLLALGLLMGAGFGGRVHVEMNGASVTDMAAAMGQEQLEKVATGVGMGFMITMGGLFLIPAFVIFFYCLGALFDERRDRSVLFWKSLPVSDAATVLSKLATALGVTPLITLGVATVTGLLVLAMGTAAASFIGAGALVVHTLTSSSVLLAPLQIAALLPVYALWALPTVGWLLMVSAWARSKPFLWAVGVPLGGGLVLTWLNRMLGAGWDLHWYWVHVAARGLGGTLPGSWLSGGRQLGENLHPPANLGELVAVSWSLLGTPALWLGVLAGAAMVAVAIRLRRWRDAE